jgi:hypothetical protein
MENSDLVAAKAAQRNSARRYNGHNGHNVGSVKHRLGKTSTTSFSRRQPAPQQFTTEIEGDTVEETPENTEPVEPKESKEPILLAHYCRTPKPPAEFPEIDMPIPYLESLPELVGWTDVFVHRIGELVLVTQKVS